MLDFCLGGSSTDIPGTLVGVLARLNANLPGKDVSCVPACHSRLSCCASRLTPQRRSRGAGSAVVWWSAPRSRRSTFTDTASAARDENRGCQLRVHPEKVQHGCVLAGALIVRHYLVEAERIEQLPLVPVEPNIARPAAITSAPVKSRFAVCSNGLLQQNQHKSDGGRSIIVEEMSACKS